MLRAKATEPSPVVFVLEIEGRTILAFRASTHRQAQELGKEDWLQEDLKQMTAGHAPFWDGKAPIRVRRAQPEEAVRYAETKVENAAGDLPLVTLFGAMTSRMQAWPVFRVYSRRDDNRNICRNVLHIGSVDVQPCAAFRARAFRVTRSAG